MILHAFDIPESQQDRARWLERMVTGIHLSELIAELKAVHGPASTEDLSVILGDDLPSVLHRGLGGLSEQQLQSLLTNPECMFDLQEQVLINGSSYWQHVSDQDHNVSAVVGSGSGIVAASGGRRAGSIERASAFDTQQSWYKHPLLVAVTTAAVVLLAVNLRQFFGPPKSDNSVKVAAAQGWGWDASDAIPSDLTPAAYLNDLADSAEEWFQKRPANSRDLAIRIAELRKGCTKLILSDHQSLADADRTWLVDKCRAWAEKLDAHLAAAETGDTPITVRDATDQTVRKIVDVMRERAKELA